MFVVEIFEGSDRVLSVGSDCLVNLDHFDEDGLRVDAVAFTIGVL